MLLPSGFRTVTRLFFLQAKYLSSPKLKPFAHSVVTFCAWEEWANRPTNKSAKPNLRSFFKINILRRRPDPINTGGPLRPWKTAATESSANGPKVFAHAAARLEHSRFQSRHGNSYFAGQLARSEERRVGKECRSRWLADH